MKKVHALIIAMLFITYCTKAQIRAGLKAGINLSSINGEDFDDPSQKSLMGLVIGGLVNYAINEKISIQPELFFSQEGTQWKDSEYEQKNRLNYINIPILVQYNAPSGFFAHTGPQAGLLLSAKSKFKEESLDGINDGGSGGSSGGSTSGTRDIKKFHSGTVISWVLGAGYLHESGFGVNARYNLGLSNTISKTGDGKATSSVFNIGIIYMLSSLKK